MAGCSHIAWFMAGATITGQVAASAALVRRLSASPWASLARVFALAGATRKASALRTSSRWLAGSCSGTACPGNAPRSGSRSHSCTRTGAPVSAANDGAPTKRCAAGVWTTRTACPPFVARRTTSSALYAAIPPVTPRRMRATAGLPNLAYRYWYLILPAATSSSAMVR